MALQQALRHAFDEQLWPAAPRPQGLLPYLEALIPNPAPANITALVQAARILVQSMEEEGRALAAQGLENAYHNREHIMDVLQALRWLLDQQNHGLKSEAQMLLTLAMIAHDYGHNGGINQHPYQLEAQSFALVRPILEDAGVSVRQQARIRRLIFLTDPQCQPRIQKMADSVFTTQVQLAVEADLLASLMPARGFYLGACLAQEQMAHGLEQAGSFATLAGRRHFLAAVRFTSAPAQSLGLETLRLAQLATITEDFAPMLEVHWSASLGQAYAAQVAQNLEAGL